MRRRCQRSPLTRTRSRIREDTYMGTTTHQDAASVPIEHCRTKTRPAQTKLGSLNDERSVVRPPRSGSTGRLQDHASAAMFIAGA